MTITESLLMMDELISYMLFPILLIYIFFGFDDLVLDLMAWAKGFHAGRIEPLRLDELRSMRQKRIAVAVAAWKEFEVITRMIRGNQRSIEYQNYKFFVGVYPNDVETVKAVNTLRAEIPNLEVVVNVKDGPTSKGQMLNEVLRRILSEGEQEKNNLFDVILIHDSEDIIHPFALMAVNAYLDDSDFVQIPVFSLEVKQRQWVAGIYMDEFAEVHTKDIRIRNHLTGCFPAAGVGMAMSRKLALRYLNNHSEAPGEIFNESSLTEDYELGLTAESLGGRCRFLCLSFENAAGEKEIVATREFFPKRIRRSIKQKCRWTIGIAFQGWERLGWRGSAWHRYFLFRDRKGPLANATVFIGSLIWVYAVFRWNFADQTIFRGQTVMENGFLLTIGLMVNRIFQKSFACALVYGWPSALGTPFRTVGANFINFAASAMAVTQYLDSKLRGAKLKWAKTDHELPENFGLEPVSEQNAKSRKRRKPAMAVWAAILMSLALPAQGGAQAENDFKGVSVDLQTHVPREIGKAPYTLQRLDSNTQVVRDPSFECLRLYYDASEDPTYMISRYFAIFLENLLGRFPEFQLVVEPVENYQVGQIEECRASFYIGSHFDAKIPQAFFQDVAKTKRNIVWLGYSIWKFSEEDLQKAFGISYLGYLTGLDWERRDSKNRPTFYRDIQYKGETFPKYGEFVSGSTTEFYAPFEMAAVKATDPQASVLATARHNGTSDELPYIIKKDNRIYVTDVPFTFMHESDRYLVFADLLFDILNVKPKYGSWRPAVFRFEDVHSRLPVFQLKSIASVAKKNRIPMHISLIPIFSDPFSEIDQIPGEDYIPIHEDAEFLKIIREWKNQEVVYLWHGVTHQYGKIRNPYTGLSGDDYEFWDISRNGPVVEDSSDWVIGRLDEGWQSMSKAGLAPKIWMVPHYLASGLDYAIFARLFSWTIGRASYRPVQLEGQPQPDQRLLYSVTGLSESERRKAAFENLRVSDLAAPAGQFFPFEIHRDVYGQRVFPENLGHIQPAIDEHVTTPRSVDDILRDARRNLKLRDIWGSFFVHPQLVNTVDEGGIGEYPGDAREISRLVKEMKAMGYRFVNLDKFIANQGNVIPPETVRIPLKREQIQ